MTNLKSEILFNRALLWFVLACLMRENMPLASAYFAVAGYNIWRSFDEWMND